MIGRALNHVRGNAIAYVALFFAIGGGGGAAIAATVTASSNTIHACVSKKTGAIYVAKKCSRSERALSFNQRGPRGAAGKAGAAGATGPAGTSAVVAYASVSDNGVVGDQQGLTITQVAVGTYNVSVSSPGCVDHQVIPVASPYGGPAAAGPESGVPVAIVGPVTGQQFSITAGDVQNGSIAATDQGFTLLVECGQ